MASAVREAGASSAVLLIQTPQRSTMKTILYASALAVALSLGTGCSSRSKTERSAAVGAATGAVIGGIIGNQSGNPRTGAAIGALAGGAAGAAYGHNQDRPTSSSSSMSDSDYYMSLMTSEEIDILRSRARAAGNPGYPLTEYLTEQEKANLRHRDATRREIGR